MKVSIRTVDEKIFSGTAIEVTLPGMFGKIGIRPHHATLSAVLISGEILVNQTKGQKSFTLNAGIAHVNKNTVDILLSS